jgi:hypothetical protein
MLRSQQDSEITLATPLYSTSTLEQDSVDCLLEEHEVVSKKHTIADVVRRVSRYPP